MLQNGRLSSYLMNVLEKAVRTVGLNNFVPWLFFCLVTSLWPYWPTEYWWKKIFLYKLLFHEEISDNQVLTFELGQNSQLGIMVKAEYDLKLCVYFNS
jgi:hypothetical protein